VRAIVTGGAGFIGSHVVDALVARGDEVAVLDDLSSGKRENVSPGATLVVADIRDEAAVSQAFAELRPEACLHLAAQADVRVSVARPVFDAEVNIVGSLNVLEGARLGGSRKVVFASSGGTIYGEPAPADLPVRESHPQQPVSPYGVAKKVVTDYLHVYRELHALEFTSLAMANIYGPRQDPHGEAGVVSIFAGLLLAGTPCTIFGDGTQTRDFVYVDDAVDAFVRAADRGSGLLCNVGTGVETSVNELYQAMADAAGVSLPPTYGPARAGELARSALDPGRAALHLGWEPWTELASGVADVLAWSRG
jgi:UDP-glucose 4-epimerase